MSINPATADVNTISQENIKILTQYMLMQKDFEIYRKETRIYNGKEYLYEFDNMNPAPEDACPFSIPSDFRIKSRQVMRARGPRKDPEIKYPKLAKEARAGYISDRTLLETYTLRLTERPLILYSPPGEESSIFYGMVKGCDSYNSRTTDKLNQASAVLAENYKSYYFLTFTYAYNIWGTDIVEAWKLFNEQLAYTFKVLRKKYKMGYVCVLESTKKGYPHAHIILGTNQSTENWHADLPDGKKIENGQMYDFVKDRVASPIFALQKAGSIGLVKYLGKYIAKGSEALSTTGLNEKGQLKSSSRKALLSCMLPVLASVRGYRTSIRDNIIPSRCFLNATQEDFDELQTLINLGWCTPEGDLTLIRLLNKLTTSCHSKCWAVFNKQAKKQLEHTIGYYSTAPPDILEDFQAFGLPMGCPGCIITSFLYNLQNRNKEQIPMPGKVYQTLRHEARSIEYKKVYTQESLGRKFIMVKK